MVFFGSRDHTFYAVDEDDGSLIWSYFTGASRLRGSPAIAYGMAFTGNENGKVYAFGEPEIEVGIDIKPGSCPNPLNLKSRGVLPVAILGSEDFDVNTIHLVSLRLEGVAPIRSSYEDVTGSARDTDDCNCMEEGPDGYTDLMLKFETQEIVEALADTYDNIGKSDILPMEMTGELSDATLIEGWDCIQIVGKVPEWIAVKKFDANSDGMVNMEDFALMAEQWMKSYSLDL